MRDDGQLLYPKTDSGNQIKQEEPPTGFVNIMQTLHADGGSGSNDGANGNDQRSVIRPRRYALLGVSLGQADDECLVIAVVVAHAK